MSWGQSVTEVNQPKKKVAKVAMSSNLKAETSPPEVAIAIDSFNAYYGDFQAIYDVNLKLADEASHRFYRPFWVREEHVAEMD